MGVSRPLDELIERTPDLPWLERASCGELELHQLDLFFVEAGRTIIIDRELTLKQAKSARIAVVGIVKPPPQSGGS